jgi:hypothetical protein
VTFPGSNTGVGIYATSMCGETCNGLNTVAAVFEGDIQVSGNISKSGVLSGSITHWTQRTSTSTTPLWNRRI